jgi:hypothetical protein
MHKGWIHQSNQFTGSNKQNKPTTTKREKKTARVILDMTT